MAHSSPIDYEGLNRSLLNRARDLFQSWYPNGRFEGKEFKIGNRSGEVGGSLSIDINTGLWADFATGDKGGDIVSYYAYKEGLKQGEAATALSKEIGFEVSSPQNQKNKQAINPPLDHVKPAMVHFKHGNPTASYTYRNTDLSVLFYISKYNTDGGKQFCWWTWDGKDWVPKGWPEPRPLYGLDLLAKDPTKAVLVVEGEKCADAGNKLLAGPYITVSWPGGAVAWKKADWSALKGRKVLLWPDNDEPGIKAMQGIGNILASICSEVKILDTSDRLPKWDIADAESSGWTFDQFVGWAKPRVSVVEKVREPELMPISKPPETDKGSGNQEPIDSSTYSKWDKLGIVSTKNGNALPSLDNAEKVLTGIPEIKNAIWYDEFHNRYFTDFDLETWKTVPAHEWTDADILNMTMFMQRAINLKKMSDETVAKAAMYYANKNVRNEPKDWMESLIWDGKERIDRFFIDCLGADDSEYTRSASKNMWIGLIARIYKPGCQVDNMVILEGNQGAFKTTTLRTIGGKWYTAINESVQSKDFFLVLHGRMIIEIPEMHTFSRADVNKIKQIITCTTDRFRMPYARTAQDHPRQSIFIGTTNDSHYLSDPTGGRRFWPVKCNRIDVELMQEQRDQLFAEAVAKYKKGDLWWLMPAEETAKAQEERRNHDAWEDQISYFLIEKDVTTTIDIMAYMKIDIANVDILKQRRLGSVMRVLGWKKINQIHDGRIQNVWIKENDLVVV